MDRSQLNDSLDSGAAAGMFARANDKLEGTVVAALLADMNQVTWPVTSSAASALPYNQVAQQISPVFT